MDRTEILKQYLQTLGLSMPTSPIEPEVRLLRNMGVASYLTWQGLTNEEVAADQVLEWLRRLPIRPTLAVCYYYSHRLATSQGSNWEVQSQIAEVLLSDFLRPGATQRLRGDSGPAFVLVHSEQLLEVIALVLVHGRDEPGDLLEGPEAMWALGRVFLAVSGLRESTSGDSAEDVAALIVRQHFLTGVESPGRELARWHELIFELAQHAYISPVYGCDFAGEFERAFGVTIERFFTASAACAFFFTLAPNQVETRFADDSHPFWSLARWVYQRLRTAGYTNAELDLFAPEPAWFRCRLDHSLRVHEHTLLPFQQRPFVRFEGEAILPLNYELTLRSAASSPYWLLDTYFQSLGKPRDFRGAFGSVFEAYVCRVVASMADHASGPHRVSVCGRDVPDYKRVGSPGLVAGADAYLLENGRLFVFEATLSSIRLDVALSGNGQTLTRYLGDKFVTGSSPGKLGQLSRVCTDFAAGFFDLPGISREDVDEVQPLLVTLHPFPIFPTTRVVLDNLVADAGLFETNGGQVALSPYEIVEIHDLEVLEREVERSHASITDVFRGWRGSHTHRALWLRNYLFHRFGKVGIESGRMHESYERFHAHLRESVVKQGIVEDDQATAGESRLPD